MRAKESKAWIRSALISVLISAALLLLCSMSSPLYPINIWDDANCLLTVGRVMKEGGVLYRDIYEQKGPLLYGIHMLSAMISDSSFLGVYVFEVFFFAAAIGFAQKLSRLWISRSSSWAAAILFGACMVTSRAFARGDSAEEFCLPFLMAALYVLCVQGRKCKGAPGYRSMFILGVLAGFVATIKYTALGLFVGLCLAQGAYLLAHRDVKRVVLSAGVFVLGMALPIVPWIIYFTAHGALRDAYTAYIHNNIFLYRAEGRSVLDIALEIIRAGKNNLLWAVPAVLGVCLFAVGRGKAVYLRIAVLLSAVCAGTAVFLPGEIYPYYPLVLGVFAPFGLAALLAFAERRMRSSRIILPSAVVFSLIAAVFFSPNAFLRGVPLEETAQGRLAAHMEPGATLLQYSHLDDGLYLTSGALPQDKYFVLLNVEYGEMRTALDQAVMEGKPDYVLVSWRELPEEFERYSLVATEVSYDDENQQNKVMHLYRRKGGVGLFREVQRSE